MTRRPTLLRLDSEGPILDYIELPEYNEKGIRTWALFCAMCFSEKENPPKEAYFLSHYYNDPNRDDCKIFIAFDRSSKTWCGTVRTIRRSIWCGEDYINIIGIADVCTDRRCRGMGVGFHLLSFVIENRKQAGEHTFLLHANEKFHSFYTRCSFHMLRSHWSVVSAHITERDVNDYCHEYKKKLTIVDAMGEDIAASAGLFAKMSEHISTMLYLQGTTEKTVNYMKNWIPGAQILDPRRGGGKFYCLCDRKYIENDDISNKATCLRAAIGYVVVGPPLSREEGHFRVYDVGVLPLYADRFADYLLYFALELSRDSPDPHREHVGQIKFEIPSAVGIYLSSTGLFESHMSEVDNEFMIFTDDLGIRDIFDSEFSFWPIDYF